MEVRNLSIFFLLLLAVRTWASEGGYGAKPVPGGSDVGYWSVGDCMMAEFALDFIIHPHPENGNITEKISIPWTAEVDSDKKNCADSIDTFSLTWNSEAKNDSSVLLGRNVTIVFALNANRTLYGVERVYAFFDLAKYQELNDKNETVNHTSQVVVDTGSMPDLQFHTPVNRSYSCADTGPLTLITSLMFDYANWPPKGIKLVDSNVDATHVRFDAFRDIYPSEPGFRRALDCTFQAGETVPIVIGVCLAILIVGILAFYAYGRRRWGRRRDLYESI